jgi:hypothetical protein
MVDTIPGVRHCGKGCMAPGGDGSIVSSALGTPGSIPLYICLPTFRGSVGSGHYFPITGGTYQEMTSTKEHLKHRDFLYRDTCNVSLSRGLAVPENQARELAFLANL